MKYWINAKKAARNISDTLKRKVLTLVSDNFRRDTADIWAQMIEPYVPKDTGKLRNSYTITSDYRVRYNTDYATKVYEVPAKHYTTPGTTHHWDMYAKPIVWDEYMAAVNKLARDYISRTK